MKKWSLTTDGKTFFPRVFDSTEGLPPAMYRIRYDRDLGGTVFDQMSFNTQHLIKFPDAPNQQVLNDIKSFWKRRNRFEKFQFPYKRGILMHGPPGCGKTTTVTQISQQLVKDGGYVFKFPGVGLLIEAMQILRKRHKESPVVCVMEDLDRILYNEDISEVLNLLDGIGQGLDNIIYLATTNNPDDLHNNIKNRPSRFDRRIEFGPPTAKSREIYFNSLIKVGDERSDIVIDDLDIDVERWVKESDKLSFAHLKEIFVSVVCFGRDFSEVVAEVQNLNAAALEEDEDTEGLYEETNQIKGTISELNDMIEAQDSGDIEMTVPVFTAEVVTI